MKTLPWRWVAIGIAAYAVFLLITLPAAFMTKRLMPLGIIVADASGSVWSGRAGAVQYRGLVLGPTQWRVKPLGLLAGRLTVELNTKRDDGRLDATVSTRFGSSLLLTHVNATLPLSTIGSMSGGMVRGWQGTVQASIDSMELTQGWPTAIEGSINVVDLVGPPSQPTSIGGYRVTFAESESANEVVGALSSLDGTPLDAIGTVRLLPNRSYLIDAQVGVREGAPQSIRRSLEYLGAPDAQGRRPLSISGTL